MLSVVSAELIFLSMIIDCACLQVANNYNTCHSVVGNGGVGSTIHKVVLMYNNPINKGVK